VRLEAIDRLVEPDDLRTIMGRASAPGSEKIYARAFRRLCELGGAEADGDLEREFAQTLAAYEHLLVEKSGKTTVGTKMRRKVSEKGVEQCLAEWPHKKLADEFAVLVERSMPELTAEYLLVKHADRFHGSTVNAARARLTAAGV
jgi:hypothetical protein